MSLPEELQELQDKKAKLENESLSLEQEQKKLEEKARVLEETINQQNMIQGLTNRNEATRQNISQLKSKINDLNQRMKHVKQEPQAAEPAEVSMKITEAVLVGPVEKETVMVTASTGSIASDMKDDENSDQESEKKKRRFF